MAKLITLVCLDCHTPSEGRLNEHDYHAVREFVGQYSSCKACNSRRIIMQEAVPQVRVRRAKLSPKMIDVMYNRDYDKILQKLPKVEKKLLTMRKRGLSFDKIAMEEKTDKQAVRNLYAKAVNRMYRIYAGGDYA